MLKSYEIQELSDMINKEKFWLSKLFKECFIPYNP